MEKRLVPPLHKSIRILQILHECKSGQMNILKGFSEICNMIKDEEDELFKSFENENFIINVCLSFRHDFGLLSEEEQNKLKFEAKEYIRAITNNKDYIP